MRQECTLLATPLSSLLAVLCAALPAQGRQEPTAPPPLPEQAPQDSGAGEARQEMIELFHQVERRLAEIDELLYDASTGQPSARGHLAGVAEAGLGELLERSKTHSEEVLQNIDRILEIARQFGQSQSQGEGSCQSAMQGGSPLDKRPGTQGKQEQTPELSDSGGGHGEQQDQSQRPGGERPESPREPVIPADDPQNRDRASEPPPSESGRVEVLENSERWGDLPEHVRDLFRTEGGRDMPPQYRDWIDGYYRRLNRRP